MKLEHKIGIAITCTFLCLVGAVIGLKMREQPAAESPSVAVADAADALAEPKKVDAETTHQEHKNTKKPSFVDWDDKPTRSKLSSNIPSDSYSSSKTNQKQSDSPAAPPEKSAPKSTPPDPAPPAAKTASADKDKLKTAKEDKTTAAPSATEKSSTFTTITSPTSFNPSGSPNSDPPPNRVESLPAQQTTKGSNEWGFSPADGSASEKTKKADPPPSLNDPKEKTAKNANAESATAKPSLDKKQSQPAKSSASGAIAQTSGKDSFMPLGPLDPPAAPSAPSAPPLIKETPPTTKTTPSAAAGVATRNTGSKEGNPTPLDSKPAMSPPLSPANPAKQELPNLSGRPLPEKRPSQGANAPRSGLETLAKPPAERVPPSPITSPPTMVTTAPAPAATAAPLPALSPMPAPPTSTPTPAPVPAATPPSPPKPPSNGSSFLPDSHPAAPPRSSSPSSAPGPLGAMPAPIPLPTPPTSAPRGSGSGQPAASAAPRRPASNGQVTVYDEQEYVCKPGDTFASISQRYLLTDKYAKALQRHNQNHARASLQMTNGGKLTPGEKIYIPQAYILEQRYADAIPKTATPPSSPIRPTSSVTPSGSPPAAPPPSPPTAPASLPATNGAPPAPRFP